MEERNSVSKQVRREHSLCIAISYELKSRLKELADRYDRTSADMARAVLKIGIPMMEGLSQSEELMVREYVDMFRKLRQLKTLKEI